METYPTDRKSPNILNEWETNVYNQQEIELFNYTAENLYSKCLKNSTTAV